MLGLKDDYCLQAVYVPDVNMMAVMTAKRKYLHFAYLHDKYDSSEKRPSKKIALSKKMDGKRMLFVDDKQFIFFYGDSSNIHAFDLKRETFMKNSVCKALDSRRSVITSVSLSQCQSFIICTDELGDLQLWMISGNGLEAIYANNICSTALVSCQFMMNSFKNDITEAVCLGIDGTMYVISFEKISKHNYRVSLSNKILISQTAEIIIDEYKATNLDMDVKSSLSAKWCHISTADIVRSAEGKLIATQISHLYHLKEETPIHDFVYFPKFSHSGIKCFDSSKSTFEVQSDLIFCTKRNLNVFNCSSLLIKTIANFETEITLVKRLIVERSEKHTLVLMAATFANSAHNIMAFTFDNKTAKLLTSTTLEKFKDFAIHTDNTVYLLDDSLSTVSRATLSTCSSGQAKLTFTISKTLKVAIL